MKQSLASLLLSATLVAAVPTTSTLTPFTCLNNAFIVVGQALYSVDPATATSTLIETGFGLASSVSVNGLGYNVNDNYLYGVTDAYQAIRISANNQYQIVATLAQATYTAGDFDSNNYFWLSAAGSTYVQMDTTLNSVIASGNASPPTYVGDWVFLSGGGQALWSVNVLNGAIIVFRFDLANKAFSTTATYGLLTGTTATNFNAIFAVSPTVMEAVDGTTHQVWRFDVTGATAPVQLAASFTGPTGGRDGARCLGAGVILAPGASTTTASTTTALTATAPTTTTSTTSSSTSSTTSAATTTTTTSAGPSVTAVSDGCYTDSYPTGRTLNDFASFTSNSMTPYVCQQYCAQFGAALFGVEYYNQCYCGNSLKNGAVPAPASDCYYACSGDASQICGGNNRLNIYGVMPAVAGTTSTTMTTSTTAASTTTTTTSAGPGVAAVSDGCFTDSYPTGRTLDDFPSFTSNSMTPYVCQQYCAQFNAALFGVEYNTQCFCGNSLKNGAVPAPASDCYYTCSGDASQTCGGNNRLNIYGMLPAVVSTTSSSTTSSTASTTSAATTPTRTASPSVTAQADGCYTDSYPVSRTLDDFPRLVSSSMTPLVCQQYCAQYNAVLFGVEFGTECYCGNTLKNGAVPAPASDCSYGCVGDPAQLCGGTNRLNIYGILPAVDSTTASSTTIVTTTTTPSTITTTASTTTTTSTTTSRTTTSSAPATSSSAPAFAPFTCPSTAFLSDGLVLNSVDPTSTTYTQIESGFGLPSTSTSINSLGYNVQDNFLYAITNDNVVVRISSNNKYQVVAAIYAPASGGWTAGDVDNNNQFWIFAGNSQWLQMDTTLNSVIAGGTVAAPTYINDWVYLSGGGNALWSVNVLNGAIVVLRFDLSTKTFTTTATYTLLTGTTSTNFNAIFAISPTVFEAFDASTSQVWRFDITGAAAPAQQPSSQQAATNARDGARCIANVH